MIIELNTAIQDMLFHLQKHGQQRGYLVGFNNMDECYSVKAGTTTIIYGYPTSGKSQLLIQILVSLASQGKKSLVFTPETGTASEIYAEIIHCLTGKGFNNSLNYAILEHELYKVIPFVKDYFKVVEIEEKSINPAMFIELTKQAIKDYGIFASAFDNWNDLSHNIESREDLYIESILPMFNRLARKEQIHIFGVWHAKNPDISKGMPRMPTPFDIKGGSAIYSKAMNLIGIHRLYEETAEGYKQTNTAELYFAKIKPKVVGKKGHAKLEYDFYQNCFYENRGERQYIKTPFKQNINNTINTDDAMPF